MDMLKSSSITNIFTLLIFIQIIEIYCKRGFILIAPKEFDVGEKESVHITLLDIDTPGTVSISLLGKEVILNETEETFNKEGSKRIELEVPSVINTFSNENIRLKVKGIFGEYRFEKIERITLRIRKELLFLDTDKPFYKAGQIVKFRVLIINSDLKPLKYSPIGNIWITDRNRVRLAQWMNITFENGFIHEEMELPEEPVLGTWTLHVQINSLYKTKNFVINEYVLPTFEIKIIPPSKYFYPNQNLTWKICANYTYGKPVQGKLLTELKMKKQHRGKILPPIRKEEEFNGCTEVIQNVNDLIVYHPRSLKKGLEMFAEVTEYGTDTKINATSTVYPILNGISISREDNLQYFRAGLPFRTKLAVRNSDSPAIDKTVEVCAQMRRINWADDRENVRKVNFCRNYKTDLQGKFVITIPPQPSNTVEIRIQATVILSDERQYNSRNSVSFRLVPWYSFTGHFIQIKPLDTAVECGTTVEFEVLYTTKHSENGKIYYQIMSKGDIIHDGFHNYAFDSKEDLANYHDETYLELESENGCCETDQDNNFPNLNHIGKFTLKFDVDMKMSPNAHMILYSVNKEGNILADSTSFEVKPCFSNPVKLKFSEERQFPGAKTIIQLSAAPRSICSIGIVDKSVHLLEQADIISKTKVYDQLKYLDTSENALPNQITSNYRYCFKKARLDKSINNQFVFAAEFVDAITAFKKARVIVLSDLDLETRPCRPDPDGIYIGSPAVSLFNERPHLRLYPRISQPTNTNIFPSSKTTVQPTEKTVQPTEKTVRSYFPETWLWGIYFVDKNGELFLKEKMPDSITEWQGTSICLHPDAGLGISKSASIIGFQPFFTSLSLPYSVIRGETVPIIVTVFNYLKECLPIKIHLDQTDDFQMPNGTFTFNDCICGDKSVTKRFFIIPKKLGKISITATASTAKDEEVCTNVSVAEIDKSDTLTKLLIVEAEGIPKEETKNIFFCIEDMKDGIFKQDYNIFLNEDVIEGSERAFLSVTGDLMGPTLEGLENLVRVPTGCGEQNMIKLVPNIVVLDYLTSVNKLTDKIRQKAIHHIKQGYIREQLYRHSDGSYSAFGSHDQTGSMWLTAFVVRSFASAARYIDVDKDDLAKSRNWIISHQQDNGCFPIIGSVHHTEMKGGVGKEDNNPAILTAYVLTSLFLSGSVNDIVTEKAINCIQTKNNTSDYALSVIAYASSFIDEHATQRYLGELNENAITEGFNRYWENKDKSIAIETASYAILSSLNIRYNENILSQNSGIAKWLTLQRNSYGGFISTQDTVIAIEALAKYASRIKRQMLNMNLTVIINDREEIFALDEENKLLMQSVRFPYLPAVIDMEARGEGCALLQIVHRYNVRTTEASEYFNLTVESKRKQNDFKKAAINICASLNEAEDESNMILMEIKMISGFMADKETVKYLLEVPQLEIKRFEIKENQINLYFVQLTNQIKCFQFDVVEELVVENRKPANIKIYDYYDQDKITTLSYFIKDEDNTV